MAVFRKSVFKTKISRVDPENGRKIALKEKRDSGKHTGSPYQHQYSRKKHGKMPKNEEVTNG